MKKECKHLVTKGKIGETGSWCVDCGEKVLEIDNRECKDCKHSQDHSHSVIMICNKHMMGVLPDMHVCYKVSEGSCFEVNET